MSQTPALLLLISQLVSLMVCQMDKQPPPSKADYYAMGESEQFSRGVCVKLRQEQNFPPHLVFKKQLRNTCICNKVPIHCLQPYECVGVDTSNFRVAFVYSHDLHNVENYTQTLPVDQAMRLRRLHPKSDIVFILPDNVVLGQEMLDAAGRAEIKLLQRPYLQLSQSISHYCQLHEQIHFNCCGEREFLKMYAFALFEYDVVFLLDHDIHPVRPLSRLINCMGSFDFLSTRGHGARVNGGIFVARPDPKIWDAWVEFLKTSTYSPQDSWNYSEKKRAARYGEESVQGALYAFYYMYDTNALSIFNRTGINPPVVAQIDRCMYNFIWRNEEMCYRIVPTIVHKNHDRLTQVRWMEDKADDIELA